MGGGSFCSETGTSMAAQGVVGKQVVNSTGGETDEA